MSQFKTKIQRRYVYHGAGYAVVLHHVPMIQVANEWVLNTNPAVIDRIIFQSIPHHAARLTGDQIRFVRDYVGLTLKSFAERFGVSHAAVKKWENGGDKPTNMSWATEKDIRLFVLSHGEADAREFRACYEELIAVPATEPLPVHIDLDRMAVA